MKSAKKKRETIEAFVQDDRYNPEIRMLVQNAILREDFKIKIAHIKVALKATMIKKDYILPPPTKRLKTENL